MSTSLTTPLALLIASAATGLCHSAGAAITIDSVSYSLYSQYPYGGFSSSGTLVGNTLFDERSSFYSIASVRMNVDPNAPIRHFSTFLYAFGSFNHGPDWDMSSAGATISVTFTIDSPTPCSWSQSSAWGPSGGWADLFGPSRPPLNGSGTAVLDPGSYRFEGAAHVGNLVGQPVCGYGAFWFSVPSPGTLALLSLAWILTRRRSTRAAAQGTATRAPS